MVALRSLLEYYENGALNIKYEDGDTVASIGDARITAQQAQAMCANLGWEEIYLHPFEIIDKTKRFVKGIKGSMTNNFIWANAMVSFQNKQSIQQHGRDFDRIHIQCGRYFTVSILYKMPGNTSSYVIFDSITSVPKQKCKSLKQVGQYLDTLVSQ